MAPGTFYSSPIIGRQRVTACLRVKEVEQTDGLKRKSPSAASLVECLVQLELLSALAKRKTTESALSVLSICRARRDGYRKRTLAEECAASELTGICM